jgi:hypothetical protein
MAKSVDVQLAGNPKLLEMVLALRAAGRLSRCLNGGQQ